MDKHEYRVKTEQMLEYAEKKEYKKAMEIADTIEWRRVKSTVMLNTVSEIYEQNGEFQKSRDILFIAYDKSPESRKIVYRLGELALETNDVSEASDCYEEFVKLAPKDSNRFILKYKILRASNASIEEQIKTLEAFKEEEYVEKWAYELATLYEEAGMTEKCLEECDDLILWFNEGKYIYRAMELKQKYRPLTPLQKEKYEQYVKESSDQGNAPEDVAMEEEPMEDTWESYDESNETQEDVMAETEGSVEVEEIKEIQEEKSETIEETKKTEEAEETMTEIKEENSGDVSTVDNLNLNTKTGQEKDENMRVTGQMMIDEILQEWEEKQKQNAEAIENQKKIDEAKENQDEAQKRREEEARRIEEQQRAAEEAHRVAQEKEAEDKRRIIEQQEEERQRLIEQTEEEKRALEQAEKERLEKEKEAEERRRAIERLEEEERFLDSIAAGRAAGEAEKEAEESKEKEEVSEEESNTDTDVEEIDFSKEPEKIDFDQDANNEFSDIFDNLDEFDDVSEDEDPKEEDIFAFDEELEEEKSFGDVFDDAFNDIEEADFDDTFEEKEESEESPKTAEEKDKEEDIADDLDARFAIEEPTEEEIQKRIQSGKGGVPFDTGFVVTGRYDLSATSEIGLKAGLTEEQKKLFSYFVPVRGMSEQIVEVLDNDRREKRGGTSKVGNILVVGQKGSGKTVLAVDIVKAIQKQRNLRQGKVAIVTGESLNKKDLSSIVQKLRGGAIIIEQAGKMNTQTTHELNRLMDKKTGELLFLLEDQRQPLEKLFLGNSEFKSKFTSKLELPVFIDDELVTFGQTYAKENGYKLDEMGILALYSRIDVLQREDHSVTVAEVKDLMDEAIEHSQKANVKHLARRMFGKGTDEKDRIILKEDDFKI